ncbi:MAG TPA: AbrB/MazE/SpoVT family DNA-binding domain-containing protein [Candidatus Omnitrophota bacterium]|nr:AbrB/MazE/SpoVT family DNA-binding domain-containing protein [Candidatus Omnitrophota bacterium]
MVTTITVRGQTSVPSLIRRKYNLRPHTKIEWLETPRGITVIPVPEDVLKTFRGMFKGSGITRELLKERAKERERERRRDKRH